MATHIGEQSNTQHRTTLWVILGFVFLALVAYSAYFIQARNSTGSSYSDVVMGEGATAYTTADNVAAPREGEENTNQ